MRKNWSDGVTEWWSGEARLRVPEGLLKAGAVVLPCFLTSCSRAPTFDIMGSLFPAWIVCLIAGILMAVVTRWFLLRERIALSWPIVAYPSLAAFFTFLLWLVLFS